MIKEHQELGNFLVVADEQSGGKGRGKNKWFSPLGGLWFTIGLKSLPLKADFTLFTGLMIRRVLAKIYDTDTIKIKWPNDLMINDKKCCGMLTSHLGYHEYHIVGCGIDTNIESFDEEVKDVATSMFIETGYKKSNSEILSAIIDVFSSELFNYLSNGFASYIKEYTDHSYLIGKRVIIGSDFAEFEGEVLGINKKGALLVKFPDGMIQPFYSGTISKIF